MRVAYQGEPGAYSEQALYAYLPRAVPVPCPGFDDAVAAVRDGRAEAAFLPVENTLVGPIQDALDAAGQGGLRVQGQYEMDIEHCLIGHPGVDLDEVKTAHSHPAALAQCAAFLHRYGIVPIAAADTAGAVREIKTRGDRTEAAVASALAADLHGMQVLARGIQDPGVNRTRFVLWRCATATTGTR